MLSKSLRLPLTAALKQQPAVNAVRPFTCSVAHQKTATQTVKDSLKTVDRAVSDTIVGGIDAGAAVTDKVKKVTAQKTTEAAHQAEELKQTASHQAGKAANRAEELKGEAVQKKNESQAELRNKAEKVKQDLTE